MEHRGMGAQDLPDVYREDFMHAVEMSRVQHDPAVDWDSFVEALWRELESAFGLDVVVVDADGYQERSD